MKKALAFLFILGSLFFHNPLHALTLSSNSDWVYLGGQTVGLKLNTGVYITGTYAITIDGKPVKPWDKVLKEGDIIIAIEGKEVYTTEEFLAELRSNAKEYIELSILRKGKQLTVKVKPALNKGVYSLGIYIKDNIMGIGTLTYVIPQNNVYGSLGHQIQTENDIYGGNIYKAEVVGIDKGSAGHAGSKKATIKTQVLGTVAKNTVTGVFGYYEGDLSSFQKIKLKKRSEVQKKEASIITCINGYAVKQYSIMITEVVNQPTKDIKGIKFTVTDPDLLKATGGIIQGMSGSPIIQDGMLVGAVTHVLVNEPNSGYGIYIEFMLEEMDIFLN